MNPLTHGLLGWLLANSAPLCRRDRILVTAAAVAPDLDGLGIVVELATRHSDHPLPWFSQYHHLLGHNLCATAVTATVVAALAVRRGVTTALAVASFSLHIVCDVLGSRGPDGHQWPIPYLVPFADWSWTWSGQWSLNSWQNAAITIAALVAAGWLAWRRGASPIECLSLRADTVVVAALRRRFGAPGTGRSEE